MRGRGPGLAGRLPGKECCRRCARGGRRSAEAGLAGPAALGRWVTGPCPCPRPPGPDTRQLRCKAGRGNRRPTLSLTAAVTVWARERAGGQDEAQRAALWGRDAPAHKAADSPQGAPAAAPTRLQAWTHWCPGVSVGKGESQGREHGKGGTSAAPGPGSGGRERLCAEHGSHALCGLGLVFHSVQTCRSLPTSSALLALLKHKLKWGHLPTWEPVQAKARAWGSACPSWGAGRGHVGPEAAAARG